MNGHAMEALARKHWETLLPKMTAELKAKVSFEAPIQAAVNLTLQEVRVLLMQGYRQHEAEEAALPLFILKTPEDGANEADWEREELDEMEREYRKAIAAYLA